ncbi:hypothetical protein PVK06_000258 [Gossypium arboreum]|uniref:Uncharacterized protein n=1 Tax=Gossypium arboreum TaxID=29729 RepID=A0ABR0QXR2_GOSAR|nr:hypothetical protein PVK06_000258 [Gossypium arboreum]
MVRLKNIETRKEEENDLENPFVSQCHMVDRIGVRIDQRLVIRCQTSIDETKDDLLYKSGHTRERDSLPSSSSRPRLTIQLFILHEGIGSHYHHLLLLVGT